MLEYFNNENRNIRHLYRIWNWMIQHPNVALEDVPMKDYSIPHSIEKDVKSNYVKFTSKILTKSESSRGDTIKLLIELQDGHQIETVMMKHDGRTTVCVSSQIGCKMGCKFCATGTMGIIGDLTPGEIIEQLIHVSMISRVRNVVFMGMGEPLNNFENVKLAVQFMMDNKRMGLSPRQITVSTVGVVNSMYRLTRELPQVSLALSLHAPNQEVRLKIVPAASAHPIEKLMDAVDNHISCRTVNLKRNYNSKKDMVMIEYILIRDVNDLEEHAHELGRLLSSRRDNIILNLIPYNPTDVAVDYLPPTKDQVEVFFRTCASPPYSLHTRIRREMGQDIDGACGQLALIYKDKLKEEKERDIEDLGSSKPINSKPTITLNNTESDAKISSTNVSADNSAFRRNLFNFFVIGVLAAINPTVTYLTRESNN